jgi:hypothetical protein
MTKTQIPIKSQIPMAKTGFTRPVRNWKLGIQPLGFDWELGFDRWDFSAWA